MHSPRNNNNNTKQQHPNTLNQPTHTKKQKQEGGWPPFERALRRYLSAPEGERSSMLKLIPHIAEGSWVIKQSVGTVPVIVGTKLRTSYHREASYLEVCTDVTSSSAAAYITGKRLVCCCWCC